MNPQDLLFFKQWFADYVAEFLTANGEQNKAILLKQEHTERTCREITLLGAELGLDNSCLLVAETAALLHDVGRFPQWARYGTFIDCKSEDHAQLALAVLHSHKILQRIPAKEGQAILEAIRLHSSRQIPHDLPAHILFLTRLLRDADKLDIWRIVIEHACANMLLEEAVSGAASRDNRCSAPLVSDLLQGKMPDFNLAKNQADLKLVRLGWVFDLNFNVTCRQVLQRLYVERICETLPPGVEVSHIEHTLRTYLEDRSAQESKTESGCRPR
ncbi:MAG: HD domain-containing protein [Deltaproteobacteria bacterium]|nr:HD domain-containing protein [Deltaproteobacteria bacterium]MBW2071790.1 HD domain-containing protein [Deltaproteobacteria bacterium]